MIVVAGDLHLSPNTWSSIPDLKGDSYRSYDQIVNYAVERSAGAVIFPGDVFDVQPPAETVQHFLRGLERLKKARIPLLAIQGQHARSSTPWTSIDPYVTDLNLLSPYRCEGYRISGLDHRPPEDLLKAISALDPVTDILVLHQLCRGALPDIGGWDFDPDWVPAHVKLVLLGDVHKVWSCSREHATPASGQIQRTDFVYTGSTHMRSIDEDPQKSFLILRADYKLERVPLQTRPCVRYTVQTEKVLEDVVQDIGRQAPETLVQVKYDPRVGGVETACRKKGKECHFLFRILPIEEVVAPAEVPTVVSMEECLGQLVNRDLDPFLYSFVLELLKSPVPKEALGRLKKACLEDA